MRITIGRTKHYLVFILSLVFCIALSSAQDIILSSQADVDAFDLAITDIDGFLSISTTTNSADPITDLSNLANVVSVSGDVDVLENPMLENLNGLSNLESVGGMHILNNAILQQVDELSNLKSIDSDLLIEDNTSLTNLNGFSINFTSLGGDLKIQDNANLEHVNGFNGLRSTAGDIWIASNHSIIQINGFSRLDSIDGTLLIRSNSSQIDVNGFSNLVSIGATLDLNINSNLNMNTGFSNLCFIGGSLQALDNNLLPNMDRFLNLKSIGSSLTINHNTMLTNVDGFINIDSVGFLQISNNDMLTNVDGLANLKFVERLIIKGNDKLTTIDAFSQLKSIDWGVIIEHNDLLENIDGLANLTSVVGYLSIQANDVLRNVDGLANLNHLNGNLVVTRNPLLSDCCGIQHLILFPNLVDREIIVSNMSSGCQTTSDIENSLCEGRFYLQGNIRFDKDNDACDSFDILVSDAKFDIYIDGSFFRTYIGGPEDYLLRFAPGSHMIIPIVDDYLLVTPDTLVVDLPEDSLNLVNDFCVTASRLVDNVSIDIIPLSSSRPGFESGYLIKYKNIGTRSLSGSLELRHPELVIELLSANPTVNMQSLGLLSWDYDNLLPFEERQISLVMRINSPMDDPPLKGGEYLDYSAKIFPVDDDVDTTDNTALLHQLVVNSFDPNDKTCLLGTTLEPKMVGAYVPYLIRFENKGSASAIHIKVVDTIDTDIFNINSLKVTSSSHSYTATVVDNVVTFTFEYINLPFEGDDKDGYIAFKIKTWDHLILGNKLINFADIYFDFNLPVRTNTAITVVDEISSIKAWTSQFKSLEVFPNPVSDELFFGSKEEIFQIEIIDSKGQISMNIANNGEPINKLNVNHLISGLHLIRVTDSNGSQYVAKFMKTRN